MNKNSRQKAELVPTQEINFGAPKACGLRMILPIIAGDKSLSRTNPRERSTYSQLPGFWHTAQQRLSHFYRLSHYQQSKQKQALP